MAVFLGGIANQEFLGVPYYMWALVAEVLLGLIIVALFLFFYWLKLEPYHGHFKAATGITFKYGIIPWYVGKAGESFVFDENMNFDLITDRSGKVIFNEKFKEAQDAENDKTETPAATLGSVDADFIFDPDKWTYPDSYQHRVIEDVAYAHNLADPSDQIRTLIKFARYWYDGKLDAYAEELKGLKKYYVVPWSRVWMLYSDRERSSTFGFVGALAKVIEKVQDNSLNKHWWILVVLFAFVDLILVVGHFMTMAPK